MYTCKQYIPSKKGINQRGMTLVSLMVSMAIMLSGVLVSLNLHSNNERSVDLLRTDTTHNRLLMTAMIVAQKELQGAGYGIGGANENDVITQFTSKISSTPATRSILWRYMDNGIVSCRGLREGGITLEEKEYRSLDLIESTTDCNTTLPLENLAWDTTAGNLGLWEIQGQLATHLETNETLFDFQIAAGNCSAYRLMTATQYLIATISVPDTAELNGHVLPSNTVDLCLINVRPS